MHDNNKKWIRDLRKQYLKNFQCACVVEFGSKDINGSARGWFQDCHYVGVDIEPGDGVNKVVHAKDFVPDHEVDTLVCLSMLEHDSEWEESLSNGAKYLKGDGLLILSWGAEGNIKHNEPWAPVPHQEVISYLDKLGFEILDNFFEEDRYGKNCVGCYNVVAKKK